ncbi:MAG: phage tail tube protein [Pseudomonadales bacterium]
MSETDKYFYGQGKVELAEILSGGTLGPFIWVGDVSELSGTMSQAAITHRESFSGKKAKVREFFTELGIDWSATLHKIDADNIAKFSLGTLTSQVAGTVSAEAFPAGLVGGDVIQLAKTNVTSLVLTDSATPTPATLVRGTHYEYDVFGDVELLTLPTSPAPTQPFKAAYSHGATRQAALLNGTRKNYVMRYKGINLAENDKPVLLEVYKVSPGLLQTLAMITSGNQLAGAPVTFTSLLDTSKPANGALGQYGRYVELV